ncbi:MAG: family 16 glycosylhydrolase [Clostridia bacterium]|nr:family 16 glycosylhydrolase [Clostridia bacterium]
MNKQIPIPEAAKAAGMTTLVFEDDFDSMDTIDINATHEAGYKWYPDAYGCRLTSDYIYQKDSYIHMGGPQPKAYGLVTYSRERDEGYLATCGCYLECRMRAAMPIGEYGGIPAFWTMGVADFMGRPWEHVGELDVVELFVTKNKQDEDQKYFAGTLHDHYLTGNVREDGRPEKKTGTNMVNACGYLDQFPFTDDDWHTYGALWETGRITWYRDGVKMHSIEYSADALPECFYRDDPTPLPPAETVWPNNTALKDRRWVGAHTIMDTDKEVVFLTSRETYSMDVDWVRIWRA